MAYRGLGNREKAEEHLRLRGEVDLPPTDPLMREVSSLLQNADAYEARASQALDARSGLRPRRHLTKAIELSPGNAFSRLNLGTALYMQGDADARARTVSRGRPAVAVVGASPLRDRRADGVARSRTRRPSRPSLRRSPAMPATSKRDSAWPTRCVATVARRSRSRSMPRSCA